MPSLLLFPTLTAPFVDIMKLHTKAFAFTQMMLAEKQPQAALNQQKQLDFDNSFEQMLQSFLIQNKPDDSTEFSKNPEV